MTSIVERVRERLGNLHLNDFMSRFASAYLSDLAAEEAELRRDAERLDFIEQKLCRIGDLVDARGNIYGIVKTWQVVTQCDDSLRTTIDLLQQNIEAAREKP